MIKEKIRDDGTRQPRQKRSQKRVDRILEATKRIIAQKGCAGVTISGIAEEAGVTAGSMYQYFPNKGAIIFALGENYLSEFRNTIAERFQTVPSSRDEMREVLVEIFDSYSDLHLDDPVVRDIWMGSSIDKAMRDLDWEDTQENAKILLAAARPLFPQKMHDELKTSLLLLIQFANSATRTAIDSPRPDRQRILNNTRQMLGVLWDDFATRAAALET